MVDIPIVDACVNDGHAEQDGAFNDDAAVVPAKPRVELQWYNEDVVLPTVGTMLFLSQSRLIMIRNKVSRNRVISDLHKSTKVSQASESDDKKQRRDNSQGRRATSTLK